MFFRILKSWRSNLHIHPVVFGVSSAVILLFVILGSLFTGPTGAALTWIHELIITTGGWFYILVVGLFFVFVIWLYFSKYGSIRLGKDDEQPQYSYWSWFSMLFSAGMGIGLVFFSVAEPIMHFANPPRGLDAESLDAARQAMNITFFHWGFHAWAIYVIVAISLAYFSFRHGLPLSIRSALYPLIGKHIHGFAGNLADILAVFGTLFGLATSLGLGVMQVNAGLDYLGILEVGTRNQILLIAIITLAATISVALGLDRGIRRLSEFNLATAGLLLLFVLIVGPTVFLLSSFIQNIGLYLANLANMTFRTDAFLGIEWQMSWTMFYWAWWISWSPFVGMFIARISRGRTIREFIAGVMLVPSTLTFFFLTVFGNTAMHVELFGNGGMVAAVSSNLATAIFAMLDVFPLSGISTLLTTLVIAVFFVTSSDSGSLVIDTITSGDHPKRKTKQRIFWAVISGAVAAVLLLSGGLGALQTAAITTALPFSIVMIFICIGLVKGLRAEVRTSDPLSLLMESVRERIVPFRDERRRALAPARFGPGGKTSASETKNTPWRDRLDTLMAKVAESRWTEPTLERADSAMASFIRDTAVPAFREIGQALEEHGRKVEIESTENKAYIRVLHDDHEEFSYAIHGHIYYRKRAAFPEFGKSADSRTIECAEVVLRSGKEREVEIHKWSREGIIEDFLRAYSQWMGW